MSGNNEQSKQRLTLCAKWMTGFSEIFGQEVTKEKIRLYAELLADIPLQQIDDACRLAAQNCTRFPTPADIRSQVQKQLAGSDQFGADLAWTTVNTIWRHHWHPDVGFHSNPPSLDRAGEYALQHIGGMRRFNETELDHMAFLRRDFIEAYKRFQDTGGYLAPTRQEAAKFLEALTRGELPENSQS